MCVYVKDKQFDMISPLYKCIICSFGPFVMIYSSGYIVTTTSSTIQTSAILYVIWFQTPLLMAVPSNGALYQAIGGILGASICSTDLFKNTESFRNQSLSLSFSERHNG